jgi:beta-glucanase (GH16 family)
VSDTLSIGTPHSRSLTHTLPDATPPQYPDDTTWWPSGNWTPNYPIIDFAADFHVFGVEINETSIRWYVDNATNTIREMTLPPLCVSDPGFEWGVSPYMPFKPLYMIINTAMTELQNANLTWWLTNNATTLVDWVRLYEFVPSQEEGEGQQAGDVAAE